MLKKKSVLRNITVLLSGSAGAQLLTIIMAPVLSRLFAPEAFGIFALYTSITSMLAVVVTWKYELAIVLPKTEKEAANLFTLSCFITVLMSAVTLAALLLLGDKLAIFFNVPELNQFVYVLPISILALGIYQSCSFWSTRKKAYSRLSISQIIRSAGVNSTQLGAGLLAPHSSGLIWGQIVGQIVAAVVLGYQVVKEDLVAIRKAFSVSSMLESMKEYKDFPLFSSSQAFVNAISQNMMPFLLTYFFHSTVVGFYALALRLIQMPLDLIGNAVKQVYYQRASELVNEAQSVRGFYLKTTAALTGIAFLPTVILIFFAPSLFQFILGSDWYEAGTYASWMIFGLFFWFIARPAVSMFQILRMQGFFFIFEAVSLLLKLLGLILLASNFSALHTIMAFSFMNLLHYISLILIVFNLLRSRG